MELDTVKYPHDKDGHFYNLIDEAVADTTAAYIKREAPDLSWVYLEYTDEMGHRHGNGPEMKDAILKLDKQIGKIWEAIRYRQKNYREEWVIYITTDHGRQQNGFDHGGQSQRERTTWIVTNAKNLNERFTKQQPAIVDIMPSIAAFLNLRIPMEERMEIDGVPLTGKISATDADAIVKKHELLVEWKPVEKKGNARIWLTTTNLFKSGGKDEYKLVATVPVAKGGVKINLKGMPSPFYKVVIEMPFNYLNRWVMRK
jgi:predicted AlkP superfamily pyrophosphatase or phosphodiesterase